MITKMRLPEMAKDEVHVEQGALTEGVKTFKPSPNAVARSKVVLLAEVPALTKFNYQGKLWEKLRSGICRKIQRGRPSMHELDPALQVIIFA